MAKRSSILLVCKPPGITSFASLYPVKRKIDKKVGHAGTLDKFAQGLMIVLTGSFTKLNPMFSEMDKSYIATIHFGVETSTLDPEGEVVDTRVVPDIESIKRALEAHFTGTIMQAPPQYSAVHIEGVRAHKLARKGTVVEMTPRPVVIHGTEILEWQPPMLKIKVTCSKGTYIRSFARDLGHAAGSCAFLSLLERTSIGPFLSSEAVDPENSLALLDMAAQTHNHLKRVPGFADIILSEDALEGLKHGNLPRCQSILESTAGAGDRFASLLDAQGNLLAVVTLNENLFPQKVLALPCAEEVV